jgi:hypothetical protein
MVGTFQFSKHHPYTHAFEPSVLEKLKKKDSSLAIPLDSPTSTFEPMKSLDAVLTLGQEKFTRSCLCESPSNLGAMLALCFVDPKTS